MVQAGLIDPSMVPTHLFDWGLIKWLSGPDATGCNTSTAGVVILLPGAGHGRHCHPESDELIYVLSGRGRQTMDTDEGGETVFDIVAGDTVYVPRAVYHSTANERWEPLKSLVIYSGPGAEDALAELPDHREQAGSALPRLAVR